MPGEGASHRHHRSFRLARRLATLLFAIIAARAAATDGPGESDAVRGPGPTGTRPPVILNASASAHAGDVIGLQGEGFGAHPRVTLDRAPDVALPIVNRSGTNWIAVQLPARASSPLALRVSNATGTSARLLLDAARPMHLDARQLVAGGVFRIFGRSLMAGRRTPGVLVNGAVATVDASRSDEYMLTATAPPTLRPGSSATIVVDNRNGSGPVRLDGAAAVVAGRGDPFALGVGWGGSFAGFAAVTIAADRDPRLSQRVVCDGTHDDAPAIRAAVDLAASSGGGVVRIPAGRCRLGSAIALKSRVVVLGAGIDATELVHGVNYVVGAERVDLAGLGDLTITNAAGATEGPLLKNSTRVFLRGLRVRLGTSRQMYLTGNRQFVVARCEFIQSGSIGEQGPYTFVDNGGLVFENNSTRWVNGAPTFGRVHDSVIRANRFTRDAADQRASGTVHSLVLDFAYRVAVVGNTFDVVNGPVTDRKRNDGETIISEGGGAARTENVGTVASATATTFSDPSNTITLDPFERGVIPENYGVAIVAGTGAGQARHVVSARGPAYTIDRPWDIVPDRTSRYATFVWGLERALIKDNVLENNPRGIWLYQTAARDVAIVGNRISEGGGIFLRANQNLATKNFIPIWNVVIANNTIVNTTGRWMSYVHAVFANVDALAYGIAMLGIDVRSNSVTANRPNVNLGSEDYAGTEGFTNIMRVERYDRYESSAVPRILGTIAIDNACINCDAGIHVGTGAGGTTVVRMRAPGAAKKVSDGRSTKSTEQSTNTVVR
jgi:hypothetical protein